MTINMQATDAVVEFGLVFHWVLRGAGQTKSHAKKARNMLKSATDKSFASIADRFKRDDWFRREKEELQHWTFEDAQAQDVLAAEEVAHEPMSVSERLSHGHWRQNIRSGTFQGGGGGSNTSRRPTSSNYKGHNPW